MSNFFQSRDKSSGDASARPTTPTKKGNDSFINPTSTPQGSPSKKTIPPGAHDLPTAFESALTLNSAGLDAPIKLARPQSVIAPLSPGRANAQPREEPSIEQSVIHKSASPTSPLKRQGQENRPPAPRLGLAELPAQHNHAARSRQQLYEPRERPTTSHGHKKFNTSRGLTAEERLLLQKPGVKRLVNVTQLCKCEAVPTHNA